MKKILAMFALVAMVAPNAHAMDAVSEDDTVDINLYLKAELAESVKVIVKHADMIVDPASPNEGVIHLDGGDIEKMDVNASKADAGNLCHNENGVIADSATRTCLIDPLAAAGAGSAHFVVTYDYEVELVGAGSVTLDFGLNLIPAAASTNFQNSQIEVPEDTTSGGAGPAQSVADLLHGASGTLIWTGDMEFNAGDTFEDNITVDITLN